MGDDGLKAFGAALGSSAHLRALVLAGNRMGGNNRVDCTQVGGREKHRLLFEPTLVLKRGGREVN